MDDVVAFITAMNETQMLFAGKPPDQVAAAVQGIREALTPYAGPHGVVTDARVWLVSTER